jgi:hypothetical protein
VLLAVGWLVFNPPALIPLFLGTGLLIAYFGFVFLPHPHVSTSIVAIGMAVVVIFAGAARNAVTDPPDTTRRDTTPPTLTVPTAIVVEAKSALGARVRFSPTASDSVDPSPTVTCTPPARYVFPIGNTTVTCKATDASGNSNSSSFPVSVTPPTPPPPPPPSPTSLVTPFLTPAIFSLLKIPWPKKCHKKFPGYDANEPWQRDAMFYAWLGPKGPGAKVAGCPGPTQYIGTDFVYEIGYDPTSDQRLSVAVWWRRRDIPPKSILEPAATDALTLIQEFGPLAASLRLQTGRGNVQFFYNLHGSYLEWRTNRGNGKTTLLGPGLSDVWYFWTRSGSGWLRPEYSGIDHATGRHVYTFTRPGEVVPVEKVEYDFFEGRVFKLIGGRWTLIWTDHAGQLPLEGLMRFAPRPVGAQRRLD